MKKNLSKEAYFWIDYINSFTKDGYRLFGNVWWYSLVHEKNIFKSMSFHNFFKMNMPDNRWIRLESVLRGIVKYLSFIYRYLNKPRRDTKFKWSLIVSYGESHLKKLEDTGESTIIVIPTKNNYKRLLQDDKYRLIDEWLTLKDFFVVLVKYFQTLCKFIFKIKVGKFKGYTWRQKVYTKFLLECVKEDWWRSFAGDVLVEGLFFERMFKNLEKQGRDKITKVKYAYEGQAWEKGLCIAFKGYNKRGELQSAVGQNTLQYYYHPDELKIMPRPDKIDVCGFVAFETMTEFYGKDVFVVGDLRMNVKNKLMNFKKDDIIKEKTLVILGPVVKMNQELLEWVKQNREDFMVKIHGDDRSDYSGYKIVNDFYSELNNIKEVITFTSTLVIEAAALGVDVITPSLPSFVSLNLIGIGKDLNKHFI